VTQIPAAPSPEYVFQAPPAWPAPAGFDPRHGYVIDPTWPAAPDGWTYWAKPHLELKHRLPRPSIALIVRISIGLAALWLLVSHLWSPGGPGQDVGSCWAAGSSSGKYKPVSCGNPTAAYRVTAEVASPELCPDASDSYLDSNVNGSPIRYRCLVPIQ
jgi:hypothetical protein